MSTSVIRLCAIGVVLSLVTFAACGAKTGLPVVDDDGVRCPATWSESEIDAVDAFILLDTSSSMSHKLDPVRAALSAFLTDPRSRELAIALSFFPELRKELPENCESDQACGEIGACRPLWFCSSSGNLCRADSECGPSASCDSSEPNGFCMNRTRCEPALYQPKAPPVPLPAGAPGLIAALEAREADGLTAMLPALAGVLASAHAWRQAFPERKVVVVLATDAFPTACDPANDPPTELGSAGIPNVVAVAKAGRASHIPTFVLGVLGPENAQLGRKHLDAIAEAGGTDKAYIVGSGKHLSRDMLGAFGEIRRVASGCDFRAGADAGSP